MIRFQPNLIIYDSPDKTNTTNINFNLTDEKV